MFGRAPDVRDGEYEERRALLPRIVSGKLIWLKKYRRVFVSSMCGGFFYNWLSYEVEKQNRYMAFFGPCDKNINVG